MKRRADSHVAAILICMFLEFGKPRMRMSKAVFKIIGRRQNLRVAFVEAVRDYLEAWDLALIEMDDAFCVLKFSSLRGVAPYTLRRFRKATSLEIEHEDGLWEHIGEQLDSDEDEDDG